MIPDVQENVLPVEALESLIGQEVGVSSWHLIDQPMIDGFADVTKDHQFIHVDPTAAAKTPFGGTIAHGFLTLSLLSAMGLEAQPKIAGAVMGINYGFDRVRFLSPVKAGARIRGRFTLKNLKSLKPAELDFTWAATVEIEGENRPALSADWLNRFYLKDGST
ncbi:MaoC family dehydratase [Labrenzia sp. PHM005]|uniref:MaoC family dehydratase n=1 Tax=Labrenzia sp. PHM005 TaxID=2590016 RepID=UPI0011402DEF|nr:MaoC family dehydratase [Labrenzia sp. PHM005]QDG74844.1 MaoC family dehydratase [Labrenzia sp. PHM005]